VAYKADEFSAGEGKGGSHKDGAKTLEAVVECAWVVPVAAANVAVVGEAADVDDDAEEASSWVLVTLE
jgi:hypothetical protein